MRPTLPVQAGMPGPKTYIGWWGDMKGPTQKGVIQYSLSPYRQRPFAGAIQGYVFNGFSRIMQQAPYWIIPFTLGYGVYTWGKAKYAYYNSKEGHHAMHLAEGGH
ncbi:cytochrome b-c1 complex subunit 8 [Papiliotrema laurentii]|uniref:Cytochrome b-c1 complex subunit 8 n=1 Tax=Papiliotrema laurentii TaxID=5418 RepID=A0AAD9FPR5_PAPLA|nr:cytochrome b-c1 complex subunit 8 [Papiliotrema laurentii]